MQQTPQKYVQHDQKQSIVIVCLKESQRRANERHKTHKTVLKCVRSFSIYFSLFFYHRIYFYKSMNGKSCDGFDGIKDWRSQRRS